MADERVQINLSTRADVSGLSDMQKASKAFGRENKDALNGVAKSVITLSGAFSGELSGAIGMAANVITDFARAGVWGLIGSLANIAVGELVEKFKEMKQRAEDCAEYLNSKFSETITGVNAKIKGLSVAIADADRDVDNFIKAANGKITADAKHEIATLHVEALQKITDDMTDAARGCVRAQEAYEAGMVNANAAVEKERTAHLAYVDRRHAINEQVIAAQANVEAAIAKEAETNERYSSVVGDQTTLRLRAMQAEEDMQKGFKGAYDRYVRWTAELAKYEKENADKLKQMKDASEAVSVARKALADAEKASEANERKLMETKDRLQLAEKNLEATELELAEKNRIAAKIRQKEIDAAAAKAEAEEISALESERQLEWQERIFKKIKNDGEMCDELINRLNELMDDGCEDAEIAHELNEKMREVRERRLKAEEDLAKDAEDEHKGEGEGGKPGKGGMTVTLSSGGMNGVGDAVEKKLSFKDWQRKMRDEQRKGRDEKNNMRIDQAKMTKALKGEMPKAEAEAWMQYAKQKYTPDQMRELGKLAMNAELLSKAEQKRQLKSIESMAKAIKDALAVK